MIIIIRMLLFSAKFQITPIGSLPQTQGSLVVRTCKVSGFPVPNLTWYNSDGSPVPSSMVTKNTDSRSQNSTLMFNKVIVFK